MANPDVAATPNRVPWPPLILLLAAALAALMEWAVPTSTGGWRFAGALLAAAGAGLDLWAMATMRAARTNILPHRPAGSLVTSGPFAISRNPIYAGNTALLAGVGIALGTWWAVPAALLAALAVHHLAILREEAHLAARFGPAWTAYAAGTPRWLGISRSA